MDFPVLIWVLTLWILIQVRLWLPVVHVKVYIKSNAEQHEYVLYSVNASTSLQEKNSEKKIKKNYRSILQIHSVK